MAGRCRLPLPPGGHAMNHRALRRLTVLALLVVCLGLIGGGLLKLARHREQVKQQQALERSVGELQAILTELRATWERGNAVDDKTFEGWMARNVVRGRTTEAEIVLHFGRDFYHLDRPPRDGIRTIE